MNRDDIIRMAREAADGVLYYDGEGWHLNEEEAVRFANLVAAAEREACALLCERHANEWRHLGGLVGPTAEDIAARIRARGEQ